MPVDDGQAHRIQGQLEEEREMDSSSDPGLNTPDFVKRFRKTLAVLLVWVILAAGCGNSPADRERSIQGRWHRVATTNVGDPFQTLASEYVEFHPNGVLASLLFDQAPQLFWTTMTGEYSVSDGDQIHIKGKCWQGWQSYDCSQTYRFDLKGDALAILDVEGEARYVAYERVGAVGSDLPPTLIPPMPSPTPTGE
jgi:hypothetical protein